MSLERIITESVLAAALVLGMSAGLVCAEEAAKGTLDNLQAAYNGESNAAARNAAFAEKAEQEGYKGVASLFRAAAKSEEIHARNYAATIKKAGAEPKADITKAAVQSTKENLETALKGESQESETMYPAFAKKAEEDGNAQAAMNFRAATAAETQHAKYYKEALGNLDGWKAPGPGYLVCNVCGFTTADLKLKQCPVCAVPRSKILLVK